MQGVGAQRIKPLQTPREVKMYAADVEMTSVVATADGGIFMRGSQDGCLYALHYQGKEGWLGKRVQLIDHSVGGSPFLHLGHKVQCAAAGVVLI